MNKAAQAYFQTKVSTTDQGQLLIMLYDGALNYLQQARDKMLARDFAGKGILISKVIDIVNELSASLNMDKGGSLAVNLNNLYILCTARLLQANLKMNVESLDSVVHILSGLRGAYAQIIETPEARRAAAEIAGRMQPAGSAMKTAQPIMQAPVTAVPRAHARAAYGRNAMQPGIPPLRPLQRKRRRGPMCRISRRPPRRSPLLPPACPEPTPSLTTVELPAPSVSSRAGLRTVEARRVFFTFCKKL